MSRSYPRKRVAVAAELGGRAGALPLGGHLLLEAGHVHVNAPLPRYLARHLDGEAVGVPQPKYHLAGQRVGTLQGLGQRLVAVAEGLLEALLLQSQHGEDEILVIAKLGVDITHLRHDLASHVAQEGTLQAELPPVSYRAPNHPAQHVSPALVAGHDTVAYEERGTAGVLGDDAHGVVVRRVRAVLTSRQRLNAGEQRQEQIGLVDRGNALHDHSGALEAHAGVHARRGQRVSRAVQVVVELHEDKVPQLNVAVAGVSGVVLGIGAVGAAVGTQAPPALTKVEVELAARAARPLQASRPPPVIFIAEPVNLVLGYADVAPQLEALVVGIVDGDGESLFGEAELSLEELKREGYGFLLEVVADAEVTQHLEQREVRGVSHLVDVDSAKRLLG